jgi:hypothetical protein
MFSLHQPKELVNRDSDGVAVANLVLNRWLLSYRLSLKLRKTHSCNGLHQIQRTSGVQGVAGVQERPIDNAGPSHTQSQKDAFILQILYSSQPELLNS